MKIKAIYEDNVFKPLQKPDLPESAQVSLTVRESFSDLIYELKGLKAKEDIDETLKRMRRKNYYE